jgi:hypothetical protein
VFAHGTDSHEDDDLGRQCTTAEWLETSRLVYGMLDRVSQQLGRPVPLTLALFGGYRRDNYEAVLRLHTADLIRCLQIVCCTPGADDDWGHRRAAADDLAAGHVDPVEGQGEEILPQLLRI